MDDVPAVDESIRTARREAGITQRALAAAASATETRQVPKAVRGRRYLPRLDPVENPHLVANEAAHLSAAKG